MSTADLDVEGAEPVWRYAGALNDCRPIVPSSASASASADPAGAV
jgi:hypothetical protein